MFEKKESQAQSLFKYPTGHEHVSGRGPLPGVNQFFGNEPLSVVQQGLNDDLDNADGKQSYERADRDFSAAIRIEFVEVFHGFSPVQNEFI